MNNSGTRRATFLFQWSEQVIETLLEDNVVGLKTPQIPPLGRVNASRDNA